MSVFLLLTVAAVTVAKPDVDLSISVDYRYHIPTTSYGAPSRSVGNLHDNRQYYHAQGHSSLINSLRPTVPSTDFQTPIPEHSSFSDSPLGSANQAGFDTRASSGISNINAVLPGPKGHDSLSSSAQASSGSSLFGSANGFASATASVSVSASFGGASFDRSSQGGNDRFDLLENIEQGGSSSSGSHQSEQTEVQKRLFFYVAPAEQKEPAARVHSPQPPAKKNVNIIFIKAPTYSIPTTQIAPQPQSEEKTVVYVLVKEPEEVDQLQNPTPAPNKPSKPEVYFIRYKTQKEAEEAIAKVQQGASIGGTAFSANSVDGNQEFINAINQNTTYQNHAGLSSVSNSSTDSKTSLGTKQDSDVSNGNSEESSKLSFGSGPSVESFPADSTSTVAPIADSKGPTYSPLFGNNPGYWDDRFIFSGSTTPSSLDSISLDRQLHGNDALSGSGLQSGSELSNSSGPKGSDNTIATSVGTTSSESTALLGGSQQISSGGNKKLNDSKPETISDDDDIEWWTLPPVLDIDTAYTDFVGCQYASSLGDKQLNDSDPGATSDDNNTDCWTTPIPLDQSSPITSSVSIADSSGKSSSAVAPFTDPLYASFLESLLSFSTGSDPTTGVDRVTESTSVTEDPALSGTTNSSELELRISNGSRAFDSTTASSVSSTSPEYTSLFASNDELWSHR